MSHVGGVLVARALYPELSIPILLSSDVAQLQHRSIYDWAQSEHQSAASGAGVSVATRSHIILMLPCRRSSVSSSLMVIVT